jgi:DNA-binding NarL/FixJ family response regulator
MTLRVAIVDDEELARRGIRTRLQRFADVDVVADCSNGRHKQLTPSGAALPISFSSMSICRGRRDST